MEEIEDPKNRNNNLEKPIDQSVDGVVNKVETGGRKGISSIVAAILFAFLVLGGLAYAYFSSNGLGTSSGIFPTATPLLTQSPSNIPQNIVINSYTSYLEEEINIDPSIPVFPGAVIKEKLKGKNQFGQDVVSVSYEVTSPPVQQAGSIVDGLRQKLPRGNWTIVDEKRDSCRENATDCFGWGYIKATKEKLTIEIKVGTSVGYTVNITEGVMINIDDVLEFPNDLDQRLLPKGISILAIYAKTVDGKKTYVIEFENMLEDLLEHQQRLEQMGWDENCGSSSVAGIAAYYYCQKEGNSVVVNRTYYENSLIRDDWMRVTIKS